MSKYQNLFKYISYFENINVDEACHWSGGEKNAEGVMTIPYPIYHSGLTEFIHEVYKTDLIDHSYIRTMDNYKVLSPKKPIDFVPDCNLELLKAILTFYTRGEKFCDGFWGSAVKDKVFYKILVRLAELEAK